MTRDPRVVFGMPLYNRPDALAQTLESLLSQTYQSFAIVIVDDAPSTAVSEIVSAYAVADERITYEPNARRLGMVGNWRNAFRRGREQYPRSEYFAWVSDHDLWHPRWLEVLLRGLDGDPHVVATYPRTIRVYPRDRRRTSTVYDTTGIRAAGQRLRLVVEMTAGNSIYGLFRTDALERAGVFRPVLMPDRQVLVQLSLFGEFAQVQEMLWYREVAGAFSYARQRRMFFPGRGPLHTYLPTNLQHFGLMLWDFAIQGRGRPDFGRMAGLKYSLLQLWYSTRRELRRRDALWRKLLGAVGNGNRGMAPGDEGDEVHKVPAQ